MWPKEHLEKEEGLVLRSQYSLLRTGEVLFEDVEPVERVGSP